VLTAFNYAQGENFGVELYQIRERSAQARQSAVARQIATNPISNQFLFDNATPLQSWRAHRVLYLQTQFPRNDYSG
jgi:hypothetical protein